jgi:HAD superfamily hydrolase (TIGR01509 family)
MLVGEDTMKLDHLGIEVQDLFTMELFYRSVLGFMPQYRYVSVHTPGLRTVFLERGGLSLELLERPRGKHFLQHRNQAPNHIALWVADVDAEFQRIAATGFPGLTLKAPRATGDGFREAELRDPEGNLIELSARISPEPHYPVRAVIFDLDGTLIDSEPNYLLADQKLLAKYGIAFSEEDKRQYIGGSNLDMMIDLVRRHGLPITPESLAEEKNALYLEFAEAGTLIYQPMKRFLDLLTTRGVPVAVASGSSPLVIGRLLKALGLAETFEQVVSAEEVPQGKPAPDVFLEAAHRLGVPPHTCIVVEDSRPGVEAAHRGFMRCIAVPYLTEKPLPTTFGLADLLYPEGMDSFDPEQAFAWVAARLD